MMKLAERAVGALERIAEDLRSIRISLEYVAADLSGIRNHE